MQILNTEYKRKDASFRKSAEKEEEETFCVLRSVPYFHQSCCIKGLWLSIGSQNQTLYKSLLPDNNDAGNSVSEVKPHTN